MGNDEVWQPSKNKADMINEIRWWNVQGFGEYRSLCHGLMKDLACVKKVYEIGLFDEDAELLNVWRTMRNEVEN